MSHIDTARYTERPQRAVVRPVASRPGPAPEPVGARIGGVGAVPSERPKLEAPARAGLAERVAALRETDLAPLAGLSRDRMAGQLARIVAGLDQALADTRDAAAELSLGAGRDMVEEILRRVLIVRAALDADAEAKWTGR